MIGTFIPGTNSPLDITQMQAEFMNPDFHAQIYLSVPPLFASSDKPRNVWLQYLMDVPLKVCVLSDSWPIRAQRTTDIKVNSRFKDILCLMCICWMRNVTNQKKN